MKTVGTIMSLTGVMLLTINLWLCIKSKTGKSIAQKTCLWLGEIFCWLGVIITLCTAF